MAPKKKPKGKKGKGKDGAVSPSSAAPFVSEKEERLQKELDILSEHIVTYSQRLRHFQTENEYLDKEAQQVREASKVYLSYLTRRTVRCQNAIISLNDQNRFDLSQIQKQKAEVAAQYAEREREVRRQLIELENKLFLLNRDVAELQPWQDLQLRHLTQIRDLEKELLITKIQHAEQMHRVKSRFLHQAAEYEMNAEQKVQILAKLAEEAAVRSLIQHTKQVKADNWSLQNELLSLIKQAQMLKAFLSHLREQQQRLFQEHQCRQDLARRRSWLQQRCGSCQVVTAGTSFRCTPPAKSKLASSSAPEASLLIVQESGPLPSGYEAERMAAPPFPTLSA
ncbi:coiled-coil domain-containing protein 166 [Pituophis catenifer annectens]|uniref:coiled-coil domain-containing protein 166 n=1 Tax=Pituophis catenifer annectens TaxID=94852 RepID=UPI003991D764